jgi:Flp pilus assembly protein TadG
MLKIPGYPARSPLLRTRRRRTLSLSFRRGERGQALVEIGFCSVLLLMLLFGSIELSLAAYSYHFVSAAAREGTRYAMVRGSGCTDAGCPATPSSIQNYVRGLGFPGINPSAMTVTATCGVNPTPPTLPTLTACTATGTSPPVNYVVGNLVRVVVSYQYPLVLPFVRTSTITMTSTSQIVISQ